MKKCSKYAALALAVAYLAGCSNGGSSSSNNGGGGNGDASTLQIIAPKIIYSKTASVSSGYVTVINPTANAVSNLHYSLSKQVGGGSVTTIDQTSAASCSVISAYGQCNLKLNVAAGAMAGSLGISANNDSSTVAKLFKSSQSATTATLPVGIEQAYYNSMAGADGITVSYYHTVIAGVPYILVSGVVASDKAGSFNNIVLVDGNGNVLPNQQLISGNVSSAQGSTFSVLLPVSASSNISQTIKVQTRQISTDGSTTVVSTATAGNTLTTTSGVGITDMLPGAVYLTAANPEQTITFVNSGDVAAQLQSFAASNPNIEVVFSPTSLASGGTTTATLKLKNSALSATSGSATLSYNNGKEEVKTAAVVEQNVSPQPDPNPNPPTPPAPPAPTAGLTAVLSPDNNFFTTTAIGTVSRQLTLTNSGDTAENNFVITLPANFTISAGTSNSCTVTQGTSPATISDSLTANGGNCTVSVVYTNNSSVDPVQSADISIAYNYNGSTAATPATAAVNYKVTQSTANLTLTPNPVTFANVLNNGADSATQIVTVTNSGDGDAVLVGFNFSGTNPNLFTVADQGDCPMGGSLASGAICTFIAQFGTIDDIGLAAGSKTAVLELYYLLFPGAIPPQNMATATTDLQGQLITAQSADITQGVASGSGFAGGDGSSNTPYEIEQNATAPSISYTITNSGTVPATEFYLSGSPSGYTFSGCGTVGSPITLAASGGNCTVTFTLNSTATTSAKNLDVAGMIMHWVDQDSPSGQTQNMSGTQYVNVYAPASIAIYANPVTSTPGSSFTITTTLTGGYNVADQTITLADPSAPADGITITPASCILNSGTTSCSFVVQTTANTPTATYSLTVGYSEIVPNITTVNISVSAAAAQQLLLAPGSDYSCMLKINTGVAYCWGYNVHGELGNGTQTNTATPTAVAIGGSSAIPSGTKLIAISGGTSNNGGGVSCVISDSGKLYCWGDGHNGALGNGTTTSSNPYPVAVSTGGSSAIPVSATMVYVASNNVVSCAVDSTGDAYCWGLNDLGQLGNNDTTGSSTPVKVLKGSPSAIPTTAKLTSISTGGNHVCALDSDGNAYCWGSNSSGSLGNGSNTNSLVPVLVARGGSSAIPSTAKFIQIQASADNNPAQATTCAVTDNGKGYCWGNNSSGAFGNNTTTSSNVAVAVLTGGSSAISTTAIFTNISTANQQSCAIADGVAYCWGQNYRGQLGDNTTSTSLVPVAVITGGSSAVPTGVNLVNIGTAYDNGITDGVSSCAQGSDGNFYCWGDNTYGELGGGTIGTPPYSMLPVKVLIP